MQEFEKGLKVKCMQFNIDLVEVDVNEGFIPVLQSYLIKRKKLY